MAASAAIQALSALVVVGFTWRLIVLNRGLLKATEDSANAANVSAIQAGQQAKFMRQQLVGTIGAVVTPHVNLSPVGQFAVHFSNEGGITATNVEAVIEVSRILVPQMEVIAPPKIHHVTYSAIAAKTGNAFTRDIDTNWYPVGKDSREDMWAHFVSNPETVKVVVTFSYDNGFGDKVKGQPFCGVYMAPWTVKTRRGSSGGGGGFLACEAVAYAWADVNRRKDDETKGIYREG